MGFMALFGAPSSRVYPGLAGGGSAQSGRSNRHKVTTVVVAALRNPVSVDQNPEPNLHLSLKNLRSRRRVTNPKNKVLSQCIQKFGTCPPPLPPPAPNLKPSQAALLRRFSARCRRRRRRWGRCWVGSSGQGLKFFFLSSCF